MHLFRLFWITLCITLSCQVSAHNVIGGVYADGSDIEGEAGFSNGTMAAPGTVVKVTDSSGKELGQTTTDQDGLFVFTAKQRITHLFEINMGAGHLLKMQLAADELPDSLLSENLLPEHLLSEHPESGVSGQAMNQQQAINAPSLLQQQNSALILEKAIAKQIKPLRREIQALKEKSGLRDIIGGVGYIFGLLGIVALLREHRLKKANK